MLRLFGIPESEIANTLRAAEAAGLELDQLEITTCLRRGEIEVSTRYEPPAEAAYRALVEFIRARHRDTLFSDDGSTVDEQVASLLAGRIRRGRRVVHRWADVGEADRAARVLGVLRRRHRRVLESGQGELVGVDPALIDRFGAVSEEVAEALAEGAVERFDADFGIGITGIAGPDGGTEEKPVGLVCFSVVSADGERITRSTRLPGGRADVRDRSTTVAMHLLRRLLVGEKSEQVLPGGTGAGR